ncbi:MAG: hypothetical protein ACLTSL_06740 [Odoribacter splanchnicus]
MEQKLKQLKQSIPYLMFWGLLFYLSPILISDTGSAMFFLLGVFPVMSFGCSFICGLKHLSFWNILLVPVLFIPSGLIFYQWPFEVGIFYALGYTLIALIGQIAGIGISLYSKRNK